MISGSFLKIGGKKNGFKRSLQGPLKMGKEWQ